MVGSAALRAELSYSIRMLAPAEWNEFSNLWIAFNAIYGGNRTRRNALRY